MTAEPMTAEEFAAYRTGEPSWGSSPSEDMRRRLCATIDHAWDSLSAQTDEVLRVVDERGAAQARVRVLEAQRDELRELLKSGFAYVRDANRLMAEDGDLDEEDEDGANEWMEKTAAALVEG